MMSSITPPRQEIIAIENIAVGDTLPDLERREIPKIERISDAPDIIVPSSKTQVSTDVAAELSGSRIAAPKVANIAKPVIGGMETAKLVTPMTEDDKEALPGGSKELFEEKTEDVTEAEPIERVLQATVQTYSSPHDKEYGYFRLSVERAGKQLLPVRPKDIILVQDCSASMSETRLRFCREGLRRALAEIGAADRFNIAKFADRTETCFDGWVTKTPETLEKAEAYINSMTAMGNTDLFTSMSDLLALKQDPARPLIAFVITDGLVNKGITDNSEIIGEFSRKNAGKISVFTLGTSQMANRYLIDLLSYCNKGYVNLVSKGRWDIPDSIEKVMHGISRPVLADLDIRIPSAASYEIYPRQVSNLYLDRPLILYGRYRKGEKRLIFQAMGQAGSMPCDLIFNLPLQEAADIKSSKKNDDIRKKWAQRKIYHLIGEYTRTKDKATLLELRRTARKYKEPIPYKRRLF
jgi:Ca-activated chloride channel family protein